jgi:hypothetical protein
VGFVCTDGVISLAEVSLLSDFNERNEYMHGVFRRSDEL